MLVEFHSNFKKSYQKRIKNHSNLEKRFIQRLNLFKNDHSNPTLKNHKLTGSKNKYMSFSVTGDIRIIYLKLSSNKALFLDIGSHNQVY